MGYILGLLSRPIGLVLLGGLVMVLAGMLARTAWTPLPERSALASVEGYLVRLGNAPHKSGQSSSNPPYQIDLMSDVGTVRQIVVPRFVIPEEVIPNLRRGERFSALQTSNGDIWELRIGDRSLMDYEARHAQISATHAQTRFWSPFGISAGALISLFGVVWWRKERSGYFSDFIHAALFLSLSVAFVAFLGMVATDYLRHRRVQAEGIEAVATVVRGEIVQRSISNYWLLLSWQDKSGATQSNVSVPVTKTFYDTLRARQAAGRLTVPVKYLMIEGKAAATIPEIAADIEWEYRGYLLFFGACALLLIWMLARPTWRLWRRWRDTPRAGL